MVLIGILEAFGEAAPPRTRFKKRHEDDDIPACRMFVFVFRIDRGFEAADDISIVLLELDVETCAKCEEAIPEKSSAKVATAETDLPTGPKIIMYLE